MCSLMPSHSLCIISLASSSCIYPAFLHSPEMSTLSPPASMLLTLFREFLLSPCMFTVYTELFTSHDLHLSPCCLFRGFLFYPHIKLLASHDLHLSPCCLFRGFLCSITLSYANIDGEMFSFTQPLLPRVRIHPLIGSSYFVWKFSCSMQGLMRFLWCLQL